MSITEKYTEMVKGGSSYLPRLIDCIIYSPRVRFPTLWYAQESSEDLVKMQVLVQQAWVGLEKPFHWGDGWAEAWQMETTQTCGY